MAMVRKERAVPAGKFKAGCLALLDRVDRTKEAVVVTKRGRPVARLVPLEAALPGPEADAFARARAIAGAFADPEGARDVSAAHDRYLAEAWSHRR